MYKFKINLKIINLESENLFSSKYCIFFFIYFRIAKQKCKNAVILNEIISNI